MDDDCEISEMLMFLLNRFVNVCVVMLGMFSMLLLVIVSSVCFVIVESVLMG